MICIDKVDIQEDSIPGKETNLNHRPKSGLYYFFYVLFSVDTWRILIGFTMAALLGPKLTAGRALGIPGEIVVWSMLLAIGYAASRYPAQFISKGLRKFFTGRGWENNSTPRR